jgi:prepilin-type N-terminal cleavage/methylation domain-containing protein
VLGIDNKKINQKGMTLLEALVSTAIIGIGFVAVFQMVNYSVRSIDVSGERTKASYLVSMVAEDLISDKHSKKSDKSFMNYLLDNKNNTGSSWRMGSCSSGASGGSFNNAIDNKMRKWDNRFSTKRIKCKGAQDVKFLKIFDICRSGCNYKNDSIYDKWFLGKMEVNLNGGKKKKYLYFQIHNETKN